MNSKTLSRKIAVSAMIAAVYTVLSVCLAAISFNAVQVRVSEALTILPAFSFGNIWGVTIGCLLTNIFGFFSGANILGGLDIIFGTMATFVAAVLSYCLRNIKFKGLPILSTVPPVLVNAVVVGLELCLVMNNGQFNWAIFGVQALFVGIGQFLACTVIGLVVYKAIDKNEQLKKYFL